MNEHEAPDADGVDIHRPSSLDDASSAPFTRPADEPDPAARPVTTEPGSKPSRAARIAGFGAAAVVLLGIGAGGGALAAEQLQSSQTPTAATGTTNGFGQGRTGSPGSSSGSSGSTGGFGPNGGTFGGFGPEGGFGSGSSPDGSTTSGTTATATQQAGVVTVVSMLGYQSGEAAGTGIILSSNGEILTNNHVIDGSTAIRVTVESTGRTYGARVVGTDATDDVAVLQLKGASGLTTASVATTPAAVGDTVTAVGNAGGTGTLSTATGTVTGLHRSITTQAEGASASESLSGLIETNADIVSGDSGGPLENTAGRVVGIDTAASSGTSDVTGFAIPISTAVHIADEITSGSTSGDITLGLPAFLGVEVSRAASVDGAGVAQALPHTPASAAGIEAGDVITAVNGASVHSPSALTSRLHAHSPGDTVSLTYTDTNGASHTVQVTLTTGPAD